MKPGSIVFLIISAIVVIAGVIMCAVGANMASNQGIALFSTDVSVVDGDVIRSDVFDDTALNKVKMSLDNVNVYICASETGEAYLELRNFQVGTYDYSVQNKMLLVDNETSIFSLMRIAEGNFKFEGLRHYLTYKTGANTQKALYLYLTEEATVNSFDITCTRGTVTLCDLTLAVDYNISVRAGDITLQNIRTESTLNLATDHGVIVLDDVMFRQGAVTIGRGAGDFYLAGIPSEFTAQTEDGDVDIGYADEDSTGMNLTLNAPGKVVFNGDEQAERPFIVADENAETPLFHSVTAKNGDIHCTFSATAVTGRFEALSEALAKEAETFDFDQKQAEEETEEATDSATESAIDTTDTE